MWEGCRPLLKGVRLRYLNMGRIAENIPFIFVNLSLPVFLLHFQSGKGWTARQGAALSLFAADSS